MAYPDWRAGMKLKASLLRGMGTYRVIQGADQTRTSSTALLNTNLIIPVESNAVYRYMLLAVYSAGAGDMRLSWSVPSGTTMQRHGQGISFSSTGSQTAFSDGYSAQGAAGTAFNIGGNTSSISALCSFEENGYIETASTAGDATLQFTQTSSSSDATILRAASHVYYQRIG